MYYYTLLYHSTIFLVSSCEINLIVPQLNVTNKQYFTVQHNFYKLTQL